MNNLYKEQHEGTNKWFDSGMNGCIIWATGVGKNFVLTHINGFLGRYYKKYPNNKTLILLPSVDVLDRAMKELHNLPHILNNVTLLTIHKLMNNPLSYGTMFDLLIVDEVDIYTSAKRRVLINNTIIGYEHFLGLTATPFLIHENYPQLFINHPIIHTITLEKAEEIGFVNKFNIYNYGVNLNTVDYDKYVEYTKLIKHGINKFIKLYPLLKYVEGNWAKHNYIAEGYHAFTTALRICRKGGTIWWTDTNKDGSPKHPKGLAIRDKLRIPSDKTWLSADHFIKILSAMSGYKHNHIEGSEDPTGYSPSNLTWFVEALRYSLDERRGLIEYNILKFRAVIKVLKYIDWQECIIFTGNSKFADVLYRYINFIKPGIAMLYHSKAKVPKQPLKKWKKGTNEGKYICYSSKTLLTHIMETLDKEEAKVIVAVEALGRGFNRPSIRANINTSHIRSRTDTVQKQGRAVRNHANKEEAKIINIYFRDTIEQRNIAFNEVSNKQIINLTL